jgi:hypothetical protein
MENKNSNLNRKFQYETIHTSEQNLNLLKQTKSKYHIICFEKNEEGQTIHGFIYFENARSLSSVKKCLNIDNVFPTEIGYEEIAEIYKQKEFWEKGIIPKQGRRKIEQRDHHEEPLLTNSIMNETIMSLLKQSIDLRNENKMLGNQQHDLLNVFIESNRKLQEEIKELKQAQAISLSNSNNNHINIIEKLENKTLNINVFLNEECKNAISLKQFIDTIQIQESDLFYAKNNGLVEAITNVFQRELQNYEVNKRPIHCTDVKREILHIKEDEGWVKESANDSVRIQKAITTISDKKIQKLTEYVETHPEMKNINSPHYDEGMKMMVGIMGGTEHPNIMKKKVQKNIAKAVYLPKTSSVNDLSALN